MAFGMVKSRRAFWTFLSVCLLIGVWTGASMFVSNDLLPTPVSVFYIAQQELASGELIFHLTVTLGRVIAAFVVSMAIGSVIGIMLGLRWRVNLLFDFWLIFFLNLPALVTIVLCYMWFGLTEVAAVMAVSINKIPNVAVTLREGARSLDPLYSDVAQVFRLSWYKRMRNIVFPQLQPYFAAAMRSGLAIIWKIVLVVELLGRSNGVGFQIYLYFQFFDIGHILAYAISFILVILFIDFVLMQPIEHHIRRWRFEGVNAS